MKNDFMHNIDILSAFLGSDDLYDKLNFTNDINNKFINSNYPPCDIIKFYNDQTHKKVVGYCLQFALAGYNKNDIEIKEINNHNKRYLNINNLKFFSQEIQSEPYKEYVKKSIAYRKFSINFMISDEIEIENADMKDGLLTIHLNVRQIESKQLYKTIEIC